MALKLSAPVGERNRITKLDPKTGECKFKPVKTAPADVELVRLMLKATVARLRSALNATPGRRNCAARFWPKPT